jgi:ribosomal protein S18 acetylase RimI-like enzyme
MNGLGIQYTFKIFLCSVAITVFLFALAIASLNAAQPAGVTYHQMGADDIKQAEGVYDTAFTEAYQHFTTQDLGTTSASDCKDNAYWFYRDCEPFEQKDPKVHFMVAKNDGRVVGYLSFDDQGNGNVYIREMAVEPRMWRKGIGSGLVSFIRALMPFTQKIMVVTRKINVAACLFYQKLGFKPVNGVHDGFDANYYIAYELVCA